MPPDIRGFYYGIKRNERSSALLVPDSRVALVDCSMGQVGMRMESVPGIPRVRFFHHPALFLLSDEELDSVHTLRKYLQRYKKYRRPTNRIKQPRFDLAPGVATSFFLGDLEINCYASDPDEIAATILSPKPTRVTPLSDFASIPNIIRERYSTVFESGS